MQNAPDPLPADVLDALRRGNKIEAIKLLRAKTGLDLKGAKDAVEAVEAKYAPAKGLAPGEVPRSRGAAWLVVAIVAALMGYYFLR